MAICKEVKKTIKAHQYVYDSISYVISPEDKHGDEKCFQATCLNCENNGADGLSKQFYVTRKAFKKDNEILAHHYVQSFSPNENVTPELAHQIGVELAKKIAPNFQVIVSTHIDKDHIHNHFIINSVNMQTGLKWKGNGDTLTKVIRPESDSLCKKYGLNIIKNESGLKGIDQATQKLAEKGLSWKVKLCKDLDEAVKCCNSKKEFIRYMNMKNWNLRYGDNDKHITFQLRGETKKIRADTLAKQFGDYYKKDNLEKMMGYYKISKPTTEYNPTEKRKYSPITTELEKYQKRYFEKNPPPLHKAETEKMKLYISHSDKPLLILLKIILYLIICRKNKKCLDKKYFKFHTFRYSNKSNKQTIYKTYQPSLKEQVDKLSKISCTAGNIPYKNLVQSQGENFRVKVSLSSVPKLYAYPFFFSALLKNDYALVTIKAKDKNFLKQALTAADDKILEQHNKKFSGLAKYKELKIIAEQQGIKIEFLDNVTPEQLELLKNEKERFVPITQNGKIKLAFLSTNKNFILHTLYPNKYRKNDLFSTGRNSKVNTEIKSEALLENQRVRYRILTKAQIEKLYSQSSDEKIKFAVFKTTAKGSKEKQNGINDYGDNFNISFKESDEKKIDELLKKSEPTKQKI